MSAFGNAFIESALTAFTLRHDPLFTKTAEQAYEHRFAIDHIVEAVKSRLGYVRHNVPVRAKNIVRKWPSDEIRLGDALELVLCGHFLPERTLVGHTVRQIVCGSASDIWKTSAIPGQRFRHRK